jgi:hypothetical protein
MNITDLIKHLEEQLNKHGNVPVLINDGDTISNLEFIYGDADIGKIEPSLASDHVSIITC